MANLERNNVRHFLLNLLTILNLKIDESVDGDVKEDMMDLIKTISLVIYNEEVFLGKDVEFFMQDVRISELLDLGLSVFGNEISERGVEIEGIDTGMEVRVDKNQFIDALKVIFAKLLIDGSFLKFEFDKVVKVLKIEHDSAADFSFRGIRIQDCFSSKDVDREMIVSLLALEVLRKMGVGVEFGENVIHVFFGK